MMTMTTADLANDDGVMGPRGDRPKRRVFTAEYKARILAEYDASDKPGLLNTEEARHPELFNGSVTVK